MRSLVIKSTKVTPTVNFDGEKGVLEIRGRSLPEQVLAFYKPLLEWMDEYAENPPKTTSLSIYLEYFNSSSNKYILTLLKKLNDMFVKGHDVTVNWHYDEDDEDSYESAKEYCEILDFPINIIEEAL